MKSVLLGGLKEYLVNDGGHPLSAPGGRAKFFTAGTSTPETVYADIDLTPSIALGPVVYTDMLGYLPPIWLKTDRLYKVVVEQKVSDNPNQWAVLWEVDNVGYIDPHESEDPGEAPIFVTNISALKDVDYTAHTNVYALGYYAPGDWGEPSLFTWDGECVKSPEDGAYVLPNDRQQSQAGRWKQVFNGYMLDVRKFGAIPDLSEHPDVTSQVVNAVYYSQDNSTRVRPLTVGFLAPGKYGFSGNFDFSQYTFTDISSESNDVYPVEWFIGNYVVFKNITAVAATYTLSSSTEILVDSVLVEGLVSLEVEGGGKIKVDPAWWGSRNCVLEDCYVSCRSVTENYKDFTRCDVESNGMMGGEVSLTDMGFKETWLADAFNLGNLSLTNVRYGVRDCKSADSYIAIKNSQNDNDYGDLDGEYVNGATILPGYANLRNASGSIVITDTGYTDLSLEDFSGTITTPATPSITQPRLYATGCAVTFAGGNDYATVIMRRCNTSGSNVKVVGPVFMDGCDTDNTFEVHGDLNLRRCTVGGTITHTMDGALNLVMTCCMLNASYIMGGTTPGTLVNATITDNTGTYQNPIIIVRTNLDPVDSHHTYSYSGNSGTFIPDVTDAKSITVHVRYYATSVSIPNIEGSHVLGRRFVGLGVGAIGVVNRSVYFDTEEFFRIGTDRIKVKASIAYDDSKIRTDNGQISSGDNGSLNYHDAYLGAYHISGNNFGITQFFVNPGDPSDYSALYTPEFFNGMYTGALEDTLPTDYDIDVMITYENMDRRR